MLQHRTSTTVHNVNDPADEFLRHLCETKSKGDLRATTKVEQCDVRAGDRREVRFGYPEPQGVSRDDAEEQSFNELARGAGLFGDFFAAQATGPTPSPAAAPPDAMKDEEDEFTRVLTMYRAPVAGILSPLPPQR